MRNLFLTVASAVVVSAGVLTGAARAETVSMATLPPGAINNVQAQAIAKVLQENTDLQVRVVSFNGPAAILGSVQNGQAEFAFVSNDEAGVAFQGVGEHDGRAMEDLRLAVTAFPFKVGILVRKDSGINSVADLKGKRFPTGWQGFKQGIDLSNAMLATAGLSLDDMDGVPTANLLRAADDFKAGRLDATIFAVGAPKVAELDAAVGIKFLDLPDTEEAAAAMNAVRPEYHLAEQAPAPHLAGIDGETTLMEYAVAVVVNANVSDEMVRKVDEAIYANKVGLVAGHPSFNAMTQEGLSMKQPRVPYHPASIEFFKEKGIWQE